MRLNHLDLSVPDVAAEAAFLERGFGLRLLQMHGDGEMAILQGDDGFVLVLQRLAGRSVAQAYPEGFHIGFLQPDAAHVHDAHRVVAEAGARECTPVSEQPRAVLFYCRSPGGLMIEVAFRW